MELTSLQTSQTRTTTNNSSQSSKASESSQQSSPTFKFDEILDILLEDGFDATLGPKRRQIPGGRYGRL